MWFSGLFLPQMDAISVDMSSLVDPRCHTLTLIEARKFHVCIVFYIR